MNQFQVNLIDYCNQIELSVEEVAECSQISAESIRAIDIENGIGWDSLSEFCFQNEIDIRSSYSNKGFEGRKLEDQYYEYPYDLKKMITGSMLRDLSKLAGGSKELKLILRNSTDAKKHVTRMFNSNAAIEMNDLTWLKKNVSGLISAKNFDRMLAKYMYNRIVNYNYFTARCTYSLTYPEIGSYIEGTASRCSNWGGYKPTSIPEDMIPVLANSLGHFYVTEFRTRILGKNLFLKRSCEIPKLVRTDSATDKQVAANDDLGDTAILISEPESVNKEDSNVISGESHSSQTISNSEGPLTDERILKMYRNLDEDSRIAVNNMITELFFANL